ncbi:hypothetical protein OG292_29315 [Streptomyces sp. NBC_01511]|uniref:hypothetical protein n=1 Tax=Streptomyces sp. NBC_01511 TaxID=2903889 RepID=UPI00386360AD
MTYDPYDSNDSQDQRAKTGKGEEALRSERGSKPATPVVPLSESDPAATAVGADAGRRPVRPTTPPMTPPMTPPGTAPATAPKTAPATARDPERDPPAGPVQDPVHPVPLVNAPDTRADSAPKSPRKSTPAPARETAPGRAPESTPAPTPRLIPQDECDRLNLRLQEALSTFIDGPRRSVEEAAGVLEETAERLATALAERPRALRDSWDAGGDKGGGSAADTEDLRLALRSYREVTERLLRI